MRCLYLYKRKQRYIKNGKLILAIASFIPGSNPFAFPRFPPLFHVVTILFKKNLLIYELFVVLRNDRRLVL